MTFAALALVLGLFARWSCWIGKRTIAAPNILSPAKRASQLDPKYFSAEVRFGHVWSKSGQAAIGQLAVGRQLALISDTRGRSAISQ